MKNLQPIIIKDYPNGKAKTFEINRQFQDVYRLLGLIDKKNEKISNSLTIGNLQINNIIYGGVLKIGKHFRINEVGGSCVIEYSHDGNLPWTVAFTLVENPGDEI